MNKQAWRSVLFPTIPSCEIIFNDVLVHGSNEFRITMIIPSWQTSLATKQLAAKGLLKLRQISGESPEACPVPSIPLFPFFEFLFSNICNYYLGILRSPLPL